LFHKKFRVFLSPKSLGELHGAMFLKQKCIVFFQKKNIFLITFLEGKEFPEKVPRMHFLKRAHEEKMLSLFT